ncbi:MAG: HAD family phosphatase [Acidobacteriota bacterium]|nr:HAD family phosphatase [Acidobacteriota bacterium]
MPDALIFDIDGTLLDSVDLHARAWEEAFQHFGHNIPFEEIRGQIGKGGDQLMPFFLSPDEVKRRGKEIEQFRGDLFKKKYLKDVKPFPGVRALFEKAIDNGQKVALASSAKADELEHYKKLAKIEDLVDAETSSADAERSKPHPDIFEAAVDRLGKEITPDRVIIIGDSPYDVEAAKKAGIRTVCVRCGGFPDAVLQEAGCIALYDNPEDLLRNYASSPLVPDK